LEGSAFLTLAFSIEITPPPTPSPVKVSIGKKPPSPVKGPGGKKRAIAQADWESEDDVFVPRYGIRYIYSIMCPDDFHMSVLQGIALKRPVQRSL
jgi:hypothetical protein